MVDWDKKEKRRDIRRERSERQERDSCWKRGEE